MRVFLLLLGSVASLLAQTAPPIDSAVYLSFFRETARHELFHAALKNDPPTVNGKAADLYSQSIQEAMGITDSEAKTLVDEGTACGNEVTALDESARTLVFESRLRVANDDKPSDSLNEKLHEIDARRIAIIMNHVEAVKAAVGTARFTVIEEYIRYRQNEGVFFPAVNGPKKKL